MPRLHPLSARIFWASVAPRRGLVSSSVLRLTNGRRSSRSYRPTSPTSRLSIVNVHIIMANRNFLFCPPSRMVYA
jgi:hypothetical protein